MLEKVRLSAFHLLRAFNFRHKKIALPLTIAIITLNLVVVSNSFAQEKIFEINSFAKGLYSHLSPYILQPAQSVECTNLRVNKEYGALAKRDTMILLLDGGTASVNGLHRYYKADATQHTIFATGTGLYYDASGTATALRTGLTDSKFWQFETYQDVAIGWNGVDLALKWDGSTLVTADTDGHRTAGDLASELGAVFAELNTGTDLDADSWYQYKIGYYNGVVYSHSTARSNPILTGAAVYNIYLTNIPLGPDGTTHRYIYRTLGNSSRANCVADSTYFLVAAIADNSTEVYADAITDATISGDNAPTWATVSGGVNATPPIAFFGTIHRERLFLGNTSTFPSNIYWSDEFNPDFFSEVDFEPIREDDGDSVTALLENRGLLKIMKDNSIQFFFTDALEADWYTSPIYSHIGCPAPYSVAVTPKGIFYYGRKGIYSFDGNLSSLISDPVTDAVRDISQTSVKELVGFYFDNEYSLAYTSDESGESINNRVFVYDLIRDAYVIDYKNINSFTTFSAGDDYGILYSGSSATDGFIFAHEYSQPVLKIRYKSEIDAGTFDDARSLGTENIPIIELAWDCDIDGWLAELKTKDANIDTIDDIVTYLPNAIIDRPDTDGTWVSPVYDLNASSFDKLYWNETLGVSGDVTMQIRTDDNLGFSSPSAYSTAVSDPTGSDISGVTAERYVQIRINLSTTDINVTPTLTTVGGYLLRLNYLKTGGTKESSFLSKWDSGWHSFSGPLWKQLLRLRIFYTGINGTLNIRYYNQDGNDNNFDIDLSVDPDTDPNDEYSSNNDSKVFTKFLDLEDYGRYWRFEASDDSTDVWAIEKIEIKYSPQPEID